MRLIIIVASIISGLVVISLVFFQATRKTYPGFGRWTAGVGFLTVGYAALALRGLIPDSLSILIGNAAFPLGLVLQLDGLHRFLGSSSMSKLWFALPALDLLATAGLYYLHDSAFWRNVTITIAVSAPHWPMAALIFCHPVKDKSIFYPVIGLLLCLAGLAVLARPISAFFVPQWHLLMESPFQLGAFIALIVLQLGESLSLMMLNSERVERELLKLEAELRLTVDRLRQSLTDQQSAERALRDSEKKLSLALDGANLGTWDWDLITGKALWSERNYRMLGYEANEFEPNLKNWKKLIHPDDWPKVSKNLNLYIEGKLRRFETDYRILNKSGDWQWVQAQGKAIEFNEHGKPIRMTGVVADTTDYKKAEEALRKSEESYRDLVENIEDLICTHDLQGNLLFVNKAPASLLGYAPAELIGTNLRFHLAPEVRDQFDEYLAAIRKDGQASGLMLVQTKSGQKRVWEYRNTLRTEGPGPPIIRGLARDITDRRKAEEERERLRNQLLQAQKMEAIGTLAGGIAHDFNNLLTIINGYSEMILMEKTEDDPVYSDLKKILETGLKGADMVQRLLSFSKNAQISLQPLDLNLMVENSVNLMKRTFPRTIEIETILEKDTAVVNADAVQTEQVLMNLCINAREAMPEGGRLRIETRNVAVDNNYCSLHAGARPGCYVLLEVTDTGAGISDETMDRMFDPFFTTKGWDFRKGTGLGLSVSKGIVEQHGGWIGCQSEPGKGTTFTVYLPATEESLKVRGAQAAPEIIPGETKILLVDDEDYVRELGRRILEHAGYTVITASNGVEGLETYAKEQTSIALVVLDLIMPQMSGEKCLEELLKINPRVRAIVSTGHSLDQRELLRLGAVAKGYVNKPYELMQMVRTVREVLDRG